METLAFYAASETEAVSPVPAKHCLPDYYRMIPAPSRTSPTFQEDTTFQSNVRACVPFQDALTAGYIQCTWTDLYIEVTDTTIKYNYADGALPLMTDRRMADALRTAWGATFVDVEFAWLSKWQPQTPPGYSLLITHPLNRHDLPFVTSSGIIDSDKFTNAGVGEIPFYLKRGFTGLIPCGTPMYQVIPIKRTDWTADYRSSNDKRRPQNSSMIRRYFTGGYRRLFWQRKSYTKRAACGP